MLWLYKQGIEYKEDEIEWLRFFVRNVATRKSNDIIVDKEKGDMFMKWKIFIEIDSLEKIIVKTLFGEINV